MMEKLKARYRRAWISVGVFWAAWLTIRLLDLQSDDLLAPLLVLGMIVALIVHIVSLAGVARLQQRSAVLWVLILVFLSFLGSLIAFAVLNPESYRHKHRPDESEPEPAA